MTGRAPLGALSVLALVLGLVATGCASPADATCDLPGVRPGVCLLAPEDREPAPSVALPRLEGSDELSLQDFDGRVVVLNFWASWCGPCRREQPALNRAHGRLPAGEVAFLGVNIQDSRANAQAHAGEFEIPYPSLYNPTSSYAARFEGVGPRSIPSTILVDRRGRVAARLFGETDETELLVLVEELMTDGGATDSP